MASRKKINPKDYKVHPVIAHLLDDVAEQPMLRLHFKKGTSKRVQKILIEAFEKVRPQVESELIQNVLANSGIV